MSSSRSVAAARARRANDPTSFTTGSQQRPRSSLGSFSQLGGVQPPMNTNNKQASTNNSSFQQQQQQQQQPKSQQKPQISVANAIALLSLRLGRLEQMLQENADEFGNKESNSNININNNNSNITGLIDDLVNRLVLLENKPTPLNHSEAIRNLGKDNRELKSNLQKMIQNFATFVQDTNNKFLDYDAAFVDLENKLSSNYSDDLFLKEQQEQNETNEKIETQSDAGVVFESQIPSENNTNSLSTIYENIEEEEEEEEEKQQQENVGYKTTNEDNSESKEKPDSFLSSTESKKIPLKTVSLSF